MNFSPSDFARLAQKIAFQGKCWIWQGTWSLREPVISIGGRHRGQTHNTRTFLRYMLRPRAYEHARECRNRECVNPLHQRARNTGA